MNFKQLEAFVGVAKYKSFSRAAKELYLTQPTISAHITALEKDLNARLFVRNTKEVELSEDGLELYEYAKKILEIEDEIAIHFKMKDNHNKTITIAASSIPSQYLLADILALYKSKYPYQQLKILELDSSKVIEMIINNQVDIGFVGTSLDKKYCKYLPFYDDELVIVTPNTSKYQNLDSNNFKWILKEKFIMREEGSGTRREAKKALKCLGIDFDDLDVIASLENQETIKRMIKQDMGISILSHLSTLQEESDGSLKVFKIPELCNKRSISLVYNKNNELADFVRRMVNIINEIYNE